MFPDDFRCRYIIMYAQRHASPARAKASAKNKPALFRVGVEAIVMSWYFNFFMQDIFAFYLYIPLLEL